MSPSRRGRTVLLANALKPDKKRVIERRVFDTSEAAGFAAVACRHVEDSAHQETARLLERAQRNWNRRAVNRQQALLEVGVHDVDITFLLQVPHTDDRPGLWVH